MKSIFFWRQLLTSFSLLSQTAKLKKTDIKKRAGTIGPKIYGVFMEPFLIRSGNPDIKTFNILFESRLYSSITDK